MVEIVTNILKNTHVCVDRRTYRLGDMNPMRGGVECLDLKTGEVVTYAPYDVAWPANVMHYEGGRTWQFHSKYPH